MVVGLMYETYIQAETIKQKTLVFITIMQVENLSGMNCPGGT